MSTCDVVTFPIDILGQVWCLIVYIPDLGPLSYFYLRELHQTLALVCIFRGCLSNYEPSIEPRLLFAADETMLYCSAKSKLMDILEKMSNAETSDVAPLYIPQPNKCVAIIDTMADVQSMDRPRAGLRRAKICKLISLHLYKENDDSTGMTFQNHYSQQQGICGLVIPTLWHITAKTLQNFKSSIEETVIPHSNKG